MLVATTRPVSHSLTAQERNITLHSGIHRTTGKIPVRLTVMLTVKNRRTKSSDIKIVGYNR
jgi:hypothetical protein